MHLMSCSGSYSSACSCVRATVVYYQDGSRASGPPERGLFEYGYKIEDGKLLIKVGVMPTPGMASNIVREKRQCV
jgi:hypothetical protein